MNRKRKFSRERQARSAFTLIELLAVIVIIGILLGLISTVAIRAINTAREAAISVEISAMSAAMTICEQELGGGSRTPPSSGQAAAIQFLRGKYPMWGGGNLGGFNFTPETALVFWLQGPTGQGFSPNSENPFDNANPGKPFMELDQARIVGNKYYQPAYDQGDAPYTFYSSNGGYPGGAVTMTATGQYANAGSFQIRGPGLDGQMGTATALPLAPPAGAGHDDNMDDISNYSRGQTFEDFSQ